MRGTSLVWLSDSVAWRWSQSISPSRKRKTGSRGTLKLRVSRRDGVCVYVLIKATRSIQLLVINKHRLWKCGELSEKAQIRREEWFFVALSGSGEVFFAKASAA